jgi:hypothetical protein
MSGDILVRDLIGLIEYSYQQVELLFQKLISKEERGSSQKKKKKEERG